MRELPAGPDAVLLDFTDAPDPTAALARAHASVRAGIAAGLLRGIDEVVPGAQTLLVQGSDGCGIDILGIHRALRNDESSPGESHPGEARPEGTSTEGSGTEGTGTPRPQRTHIDIPVRYVGDDLAEVAALTGISVDEVIGAHRDTVWVVQFMGFAPGFGYLVPIGERPNPLLAVPRRTTARTRVPAGAVAIAAGYSAIYPREGPGGWHLLGQTDIRLWNTEATPPAVLAPGSIVRFREVGR
ncbi:MAG: allophanate hydrolase subunit 1 [Gordonia sp. (in: high G+C Gram-positive bacteria)]